MRFASLGSGSRGNATLVASTRTTVLIDCGFSMREVRVRLESLGQDPAAISAVLITHEHADHVQGIGALARRYRLPVWSTSGTLAAAAGTLGELPEVRTFTSHELLRIGDIDIEPITVPHDAREPSQFVFVHGGLRLGLLTDTGRITPHILEQLAACDALMLEFNHDVDMLARSEYPPSLKQRIRGPLGHLSNHQAADLLRRLDTSALQYFMAMHLSEKNNCREQVRRLAAEALDQTPEWVDIARQDGVSGWRDLTPSGPG